MPLAIDIGAKISSNSIDGAITGIKESFKKCKNDAKGKALIKKRVGGPISAVISVKKACKKDYVLKDSKCLKPGTVFGSYTEDPTIIEIKTDEETYYYPSSESTENMVFCDDKLENPFEPQGYNTMKDQLRKLAKELSGKILQEVVSRTRPVNESGSKLTVQSLIEDFKNNVSTSFNVTLYGIINKEIGQYPELKIHLSDSKNYEDFLKQIYSNIDTFLSKVETIDAQREIGITPLTAETSVSLTEPTTAPTTATSTPRSETGGKAKRKPNKKTNRKTKTRHNKKTKRQSRKSRK
jgi:hypothetical protein